MKFSTIVKFFFLRVINMKHEATSYIIIFLILMNSFVVFPQDGSFKPSRAEAEAAWISGNYETAFRHYNGLLLLYSRDPLYKYYTGACLVKLERDVPRAVTLLASAINSSVNIKTVPDDVWFYYGRALQMKGSFSMASDAYGRFVRTAGKKASQAMEVQKYIDQCDKRLGSMSTEQAGSEVGGKEQGARGMEQTVRETEQPVTAKTAVDQPVAAKSAAEQPIGVLEEYDTKLTGAVKMQYAADSLNRLAQGLRREMESVTVKEPLLQRAEKLEREAAAMQAEADRIFLTLEPADKVEAKEKVEAENKAGNKVEPKVETMVRTENKTEVRAENNTEVRAEGKANVEDVVQGKGQQEAVFSVFEVRPSPAYTTNEQIPMGIGAPQGLVYRIQLAAFKNPLPSGYFKGLYPLYGKINTAKGLTYYYTGIFRTLESARQVLPKVRNAGFNDAFIIALMDDIQISMERALLLEKEWSGKPLFLKDPSPSSPENITAASPLPVGTLSFRAEVMRSKKPVAAEVTQKIALLSGSRGLDIIKNNQGETLYLIGKFVTFESAEEYVSLLIRNGYSTARVAAYVGTQEIPVESAKELLKKLPND